MDNYTKSNRVTEYAKKYKIKVRTKKLYESLINKTDITRSELQSLSDAICKDFGVGTVKIIFDGKQPKSNRSTTKGYIRVSAPMVSIGGKREYLALHIQVYKYTAVRQKQVTNKVAINVLLHELTHWFDYKIIGLDKTIHSSGFYKRITHLKTLLT